MTGFLPIPWKRIAAALPLLGACALATNAASTPLPRSTPEAQGVASSAILGFVEAAESQVDALHSFMLVRHGQVVAEGWWAPYAAGEPHAMYSLSKSFTSTAVGLAISEGRFTLDDTLLSFFPEEAPAAPDDNLKAMRVRDLLRMSTGHHSEDLAKFSFNGPEVLTRQFLALPVAHKPGTHFLYNTPATYLLSAIVQKTTGATVLDYLRPRLFEPLGIENPAWTASAQGISLGGFGLSVRTEDIAKFGQLYLQRGVWQGKRLVPADWIAAATSLQTSNGSNPESDWEQGYGYQFWRTRHGLYRGDGAHGQFCIVMQDQDAVVTITSGTRDMATVMNLVWQHLLPAMQAAPLPADAAAQQELTQKLANLTLRPPAGEATSPLVAQLAGKTFVFPANDRKVEALAFEFGVDGATIVARTGRGEERIACGSGIWRKGRTTFADGTDQPVAVSGAWTAPDTYVAKFFLYRTPFSITGTFKFAGDQVFFDSEYNIVTASTPVRPQLVGTAK